MVVVFDNTPMFVEFRAQNEVPINLAIQSLLGPEFVVVVFDYPRTLVDFRAQNKFPNQTNQSNLLEMRRS